MMNKDKVWSLYVRINSNITSMVGFHIIRGCESMYSWRTKVLLKIFMFVILVRVDENRFI
jgi:hypothetical protein